MSLEDTPSPTSTTTPPLSTHGGADVGTVPVDGNKSTETFVGFDLEKPPPSFSRSRRGRSLSHKHVHGLFVETERQTVDHHKLDFAFDEHSEDHSHDHDYHDKSHNFGPLRRQSTMMMRETRAHKPFRIAPERGRTGDTWLKEEQRATELLSLFFDVVVVAVLSSFSSTHEIQTPEAIPVFFSYFIVITWIWASQVHYDVRYEAEDMVHRGFKCLQIMVFVYIGAASGGWSPGNILSPAHAVGLSEAEEVKHSKAAESFLTVTIAYVIYRAMLMVQYALVLWDCVRAGRPTRGPRLSVLTLATSCILSIVAVTIPAHSQPVAVAKVALFYLAIAVEIGGAGYQLGQGIMAPVDPHYMMDRYAGLSLIILGEGFLILTKAFNKAITGLNVSDVASYAQVFLVIVVMYNIWSFLFSDFPKALFNVQRLFMWEFIHFPLHFGMMLLMAAMVNVITFDTFAQGLYKTTSAFSVVMADLQNTSMALSPEALRGISVYINRLDPVPDFMTAYKQLNATFNEDPNSVEGINAANQYFVQLLYGVATKSGIDIGEDIMDQINELLEADPTEIEPSDPVWNVTDDFVIHTPFTFSAEVNGNTAPLHDDSDDFLELILSTLNESLLGVTWLYPTAGGVLIMCALRSLVRFQIMTLEKWLIYGLEIVAGVGLGLLGLLDLGSQRINYDSSGLEGGNLMVALVGSYWSIAVIVFVYTSVTVSVHGIAWWFRRRRQKAKMLAADIVLCTSPTQIG